MIYHAHVTIELLDGKPEDYKSVAAELRVSNLSQYPRDINGDLVNLPYNAFFGEFDALDSGLIELEVRRTVAAVLKGLGLQGRFFVTAGPDYAWSLFRLEHSSGEPTQQDE